MIEFRQITAADKEKYESCLKCEGERGCEYTFSNLYLWGRQRIAFRDGLALLFSQFSRRTVYPFPVGAGDKIAAVNAIIADARERGIPVRITGLLGADRQLIESAYPELFIFHCDRASHDYVYEISDLADLPGKKLHRKRNHLNRFRELYRGAVAEPISESNLDAARQMVDRWYEERLAADPAADFRMERTALDRALSEHRALGMEGIVLSVNGEAVAVTLGSRLSSDTFDVQFEKARTDVEGAYTAVNAAFAGYLREKYPELRYLNREEDMGIEGLRKAKLSYRPHHMVEKCWAHMREDGYDY